MNKNTKLGKKEKKKIDFLYNLKKYWEYGKGYRIYFFLGILFISLSELLMVSDNFLFKVIIDKATLFLSNEITKNSIIQTSIIVGTLFLLFQVLNSISRFFFLHFMNRYDTNLQVSFKKDYFKHIITRSHKFHNDNKTGSLISSVLRGNGSLNGLSNVLFFNSMPLFLKIIIIFSSLLYLDKLSGFVMLLVSIVFVTYALLLQKKRVKLSLASNEQNDRETGITSDYISNSDSIKLFGKENYTFSNYEKEIQKTRKLSLKLWDLFRYMDAGLIFIVGLGMFFVIYFPVTKLINGDMTIGTLTFIFSTYSMLIGSLYNFVYGIRGFFKVMEDLETTFKYRKAGQDVKDKINSKNLVIKNGSVDIKDITFKYKDESDEVVFENFSLEIPKNKKVALVGHSGSGKSTLIKLLYRLYDVNSGSISIDGIDIKDIKQESLREQMSIVPQEGVLFDDTVFNNIRFSNPKASKKDVQKAIRFAQLDKLIKKLPNKENTIVGERGVKLSGGERQRVSIARAILANKKILVLDEATSALDSQTEHDIQRDLDKLMKNRTSIIIAHRLSTIMKADKIVVLDNGKIVQTGTHNDLIKKRGQYKKLWNLQKGGYIK